MRRTVVDIEGLGHSQPIPLAVAMGNILVTGSVNGRDRESGALPPALGDEVDRAFDNLALVLERAGTSWAGLLKLDVLVRTAQVREHVNTAWLARFPSADDRPVRHVTTTELPADFNIQLLALALIPSDQPEKDER